MTTYQRTLLSSAFAAILASAPSLRGAETITESSFKKQTLPFLKQYCVDCHGGEKPKAKFDLSHYTSLESVIRDSSHWLHVLDQLEAGDMPPEDEKQPTPKERAAMIAWIESLRRQEAERNAGDPGIVLARRLSNSEYDYTIRDLTGVDIRPTREFPIDPANESGFDNSGESLSLSPALLKKYLNAARHISEYLVLMPDGLEFAPHPVMTNTDRDRFCVSRIIEFYERQETDLAEYFLAAWRFRHRTSEEDLDGLASEAGLSPKYLRTVNELLTGSDFHRGPVATLREDWFAFPSPDEASIEEIRDRCLQLRDKTLELREPLSPRFPHLRMEEKIIHHGAQALVYWRNRQNANHRRLLDPKGIPAEEIAAYEKFCAVFPNAFYISERGREFLEQDEEQKAIEKGRLLSAGLHSQLGYFRDDAPLYELLLDEDERRELDALWMELDVVAQAPIRQHKSLVWFERTDSKFLRDPVFDFARAEDHDVVSEAKVNRLAEVYLQKALEAGADEQIATAIREHFQIINDSIRRMERVNLEAEPTHLDALLDFATRAYRRPLSNDERADLLAFYEELKENEGASHEDAIRDLVVSVLMSPHFWYRVNSPSSEDEIHPLADYDVASRLSYFLWSSMPDRQLLDAAERGELQNPEVLTQHARRMSRDSRVRALALEFGGNWLEFRHFKNHNSVDRERFPQFDDELRAAMFEEPIRFFTDVAQNDRSILDFLYADRTFVNAQLAKHYGLAQPPNDWAAVDDVNNIGRGGLLPMAVFQTHNAGGLRTSPVKRGYWVVRRLLGEHIPPPPPAVPELPDDEGIGDLSLRERLKRHREDKSCASCHQRFDHIGFAFEGYGPIGERRQHDLGGRPIDTRVQFPDGGAGEGLTGLQDYLREHRQDEFVDNLCRKLFSYALGRKLMLSDDPMIDTLKAELQQNDHRFGALIEAIVTSPQFRNQRGRLSLTQPNP